MNPDDLVYLFLLLISIGIGPLLKRFEDPRLRQKISALLGFIIVFVVSGFHILHPIFLILVNCFITFYLSKRSCHIVSFTFCLVYLAFFRVCHYVGFPEVPGPTNAIQMILTLKMIALTFEVRDSYIRRTDPKSANSLESTFKDVDPSMLDVFCYGFCHAGVLTGPFYKYRVYWDSFYSPYAMKVDVMPFLISRIKVVPVYAILYLISGQLFPLSYAESEEIFERSVLYRVWYMTPLFFNFRMRIYTGFVLSECQCLTAGLGLYPAECKARPGEGPTDLDPLSRVTNDKTLLNKVEYDFQSVYNVDEYEADFSPTVRTGMRYWNITVQYWLAIYVYKRVPWRNFRVGITMFMSSFWHGIYPGYYMSLGSVPLVLMAEDVMAKAYRADASARGQKLFDWISWFFKMQAFSYMGMGFYLLRIDATLNYWKSMYFLGHILMVAFLLFGRYVVGEKRKLAKRQQRLEEDSGQSSSVSKKAN